MACGNEQIAVIGLGYVGLPVAVALARHFPRTVGFDHDGAKVRRLQRREEPTGVVNVDELDALIISSSPDCLRGCSFFIVAVPTPIDSSRQPDLTALKEASETVGVHLQRGAVVVYESTVYPGLTEELCGPILERASGLECGVDFTLGYSPERINPGDRLHTLENVTKVVAGQDGSTLERIVSVYHRIIPAGIHRAPSIRVAEAAKVLENTQRDLNIALMNEMALICERMGLSTRDVLAAASTKWNFMPFTPGLVGGHCIGVDPYYLTTKAEQVGYHPEVILAGRRVNDGMGHHVAQRTVKMLVHAGIPVRAARVAVLGLAFKEDVPDCRNSRVPDVVTELREFGVTTLVHDPLVPPAEARAQYSMQLCAWEELVQLDALVLAVPHAMYRERLPGELGRMVRTPCVIMDVKWLLEPRDIPSGAHYVSL